MTIQDYEQDLTKLESMLNIYNSTKCLNGGFWLEMTIVIEEQIQHCKDCINNLKAIQKI